MVDNNDELFRKIRQTYREILSDSEMYHSNGFNIDRFRRFFHHTFNNKGHIFVIVKTISTGQTELQIRKIVMDDPTYITIGVSRAEEEDEILECLYRRAKTELNRERKEKK